MLYLFLDEIIKHFIEKHMLLWQPKKYQNICDWQASVAFICTVERQIIRHLIDYLCDIPRAALTVFENMSKCNAVEESFGSVSSYACNVKKCYLYFTHEFDSSENTIWQNRKKLKGNLFNQNNTFIFWFQQIKLP